jgi:hypothetical protein
MTIPQDIRRIIVKMVGIYKYRALDCADRGEPNSERLTNIMQSDIAKMQEWLDLQASNDCHCKCFVVEECGCGKPGDGTMTFDLSECARGTVPARLLTVDELCVVESFVFNGEAWLPIVLEERVLTFDEARAACREFCRAWPNAEFGPAHIVLSDHNFGSSIPWARGYLAATRALKPDAAKTAEYEATEAFLTWLGRCDIVDDDDDEAE